MLALKVFTFITGLFIGVSAIAVLMFSYEVLCATRGRGRVLAVKKHLKLVQGGRRR